MNVIVFGLILSFLWGVLPVAHKYYLKSLHPQVVLMISGIVYFLALLGYMIFNRTLLLKESRKVRPMHLVWLTIATLVCTFFGSIIYYYVLSKHDSHVVTALAYSSPFFTLVLAYLFLNEEISSLGFFGVMLIVGGVVCIGFNEHHKRIN
jgi:drug/metabolite transporter (DMT)-like permease